MTRIELDALVRLDINNPVFQENLLTLQKSERHSALDTLNKLRQMTWHQVYRDNGVKWEKIVSINPNNPLAELRYSDRGGIRHISNGIH